MDKRPKKKKQSKDKHSKGQGKKNIKKTEFAPNNKNPNALSVCMRIF